MRYVSIECKATIGQVGNVEHANETIGKAGRKRHMGIRPTVRGSVMNPNDHPHGGGKVDHQSVDHLQLLHGVNQLLDTKLERKTKLLIS